MSSYRLVFRGKATKEWAKLGATIRTQFERKLAERLAAPRVEKGRLSGIPDCYKIKLRQSGYRLIYQVDDHRVVVIVIRIGKREGGEVYAGLAARLAGKDEP